jgi:hypothetical protein
MFNGVYAQDELRDKDVSQPPGLLRDPLTQVLGHRKRRKKVSAPRKCQAPIHHPRNLTITFIPLPAFAFNRNEGYWVGGLVPILKSNPMGTGQVFLLTIQLVVKVSP